MTNPRYRCPGVRWTDLHGPESFSFSPCRIEVDDISYEGLIYYPHPSTKPLHHQPANLVEVIAEWIPGMDSGVPVVLHVVSTEVEIDGISDF